MQEAPVPFAPWHGARHAAVIKPRLRAAWCRRGCAAVLLTLSLACRSDEPALIGVVAPMANTAVERIVRERYEVMPETRGGVRITFTQTTNGPGAQLPVIQAEEFVHMPGLVGVVGHESSRASLQAAPVYAERGVVQIVPTGTSPQLGTISPWTFPLVASDSIQGELMAKYLIGRQFARIVVFVQDDEYGRDVLNELRRVLQGSQVTIMDDITLVTSSDIPLLVRSALAITPSVEAFVLIAQAPVATRIATLAWRARPTLTLVGSDAVTTSQQLANLAPSQEQLVLVTYWLPDTSDAATRAFVGAFHKAVGRDPHWADVATFDAIGVLAAATRAVGNNSRRVRDWIRSLGTGRPAYRGMLGPIEFNEGRRIAPRLIAPGPDGWHPIP